MKVFVTGAAGYIGGSIATHLAERGHRIVALVRKPEAADRLRLRGFDVVVGSLDDRDVVFDAARSADAVVDAADADHRGVAETIIDALRGSNKPFVHTSGSSIVADDASGARSERTFDEATPFVPVPEKVTRVAVDDLVRRSAEFGIRSAVICPPTIYGRGLGDTAHSDQIPKVLREAKRAGIARRIGAGENVWSNVFIGDLVDLYERVLERAPAGAFYFAENGEASYGDIARAIGRMLGFGDRTESWPIAEVAALYGASWARFALGSNSRIRAVRARRELGWEPSGPSLFEEIERGSYREDFGPG